MFSIICCSIDPAAAAALEKNIASTIGVPFEFIAFDNCECGYGLTKVYNLCAGQAKYDLLCFAHEDICFETENWGERIADRLRKPECGIIGFAGSIVKLRRLTGWNTCGRDLRLNYVQYMRGGRHLRSVNPCKTDFSPVVTLDGMCLFVRRDVWSQTPFDEAAFPRFHGYDLDFSLAVACGHINYVCHTVRVVHFSEGAFSSEWLYYMERLHEKWAGSLPMAAVKLSPSQLAVYDRLGEAYFIKFMFQKGRFETRGFADMMQFLGCHPLTPAAWALLPKYVKYKLRAMHKK